MTKAIIMARTFLVFIGMLLAASIGAAAQVGIYVSPDGNDANAGTLDSPLGSVAKAQEMARGYSAGDIVIYLREGVYRPDSTIVFTPADCGENKTLTVCPYMQEHVVIDGGKSLEINGWKPYKDGIFKTEVHFDGAIDMLVADGKIRHMARYPDYDADAVRFNGTAADATAPERVKRWKNPAGGFLHAMHAHDWGDFHYRITGKDKAGNLKLEGGHQNNRQSGLYPDNRMVENIFEELDSPGEWFYDGNKSTLYYYPLEGENLSDMAFDVPALRHLIEFRGSEGAPVVGITVRGIELRNTCRTFMEEYEQLLRSDWCIYRGAAIFLEGTEGCSLENLYLHNLGGNAVFFSGYNRNSSVTGSHFTDIGASAVCFVGSPSAVRSPSFEYNEFVPLESMDMTAGPKSTDYPAECRVHDNLIHKIGIFEKQIAGVELSMCKDIVVSHNSIYDVPRSGINVSEGTWGGHVIEFNDVFDTVKETGDHGCFNSWGRDRFWHPDYAVMKQIVADNPSIILADAASTVVLRNNRFRCDRGWDIDLDDGSSNYLIYNNLCLNGGLKLREGFYRTVENNIFVNNTFHPHVWFDNSGDVFVRNIVMTPYQPINVPQWGSCVDYNVFTDAASLEKARGNGTDYNSLCSALSFVDVVNGDYRVAGDCDEVFRIGFHNFDMDRFGVVSPRLKALARTPVMPAPAVASGSSESRVSQWHGWNIKNLDTLGERSATGMDSERGVYVVSISVFNNPLRDYIRANDVILGFDGKAVDNIEQLTDAERVLGSKDTVSLVIFRNQKENVIVVPADKF